MKYISETRQVQCDKRVLEYTLTIKAVKNINLRIKPSGEIHVSANKKVPVSYIDNFIREKQAYIIRALDRFKEKQNQVVAHSKKEVGVEAFEDICKEAYEIFKEYGIKYPTIKTKYMTTRWGSCRPQKGNITLNSRLIDVPKSCIEYIVFHEFAHLIHPNHSKDFYDFLTMLMPDWKDRKKELNKIL